MYRHAPEEKFLELEREADALLAKYPDPDNRARIYFEVAHVAGQSGCGKHYDRIEAYARKASEASGLNEKRERFRDYVQALQSKKEKGMINAEDYRRLIIEWKDR